MESFRSDEGFSARRVRLQDLYCIPHAGTFADSTRNAAPQVFCSYATALVPPNFRHSSSSFSSPYSREGAPALRPQLRSRSLACYAACSSRYVRAVWSWHCRPVPFTGRVWMDGVGVLYCVVPVCWISPTKPTFPCFPFGAKPVGYPTIAVRPYARKALCL